MCPFAQRTWIVLNELGLSFTTKPINLRARPRPSTATALTAPPPVLLIGWWTGWLAGWLAGWLVDWLVGWLAACG